MTVIEIENNGEVHQFSCYADAWRHIANDLNESPELIKERWDYGKSEVGGGWHVGVVNVPLPEGFILIPSLQNRYAIRKDGTVINAQNGARVPYRTFAAKSAPKHYIKVMHKLISVDALLEEVFGIPEVKVQLSRGNECYQFKKFIDAAKFLSRHGAPGWTVGTLQTYLSSLKTKIGDWKVTYIQPWSPFYTPDVV